MYTSYTNVVTPTRNPEAHICVKKSRVKNKSGNVYLKDGDEFQIELFNPLTNSILCEISFNGTKIGGGLVLKPGQRVFLERYITSNNKFLFTTYDVETGIKEVQEAIRANGEIKIQFMHEKKPVNTYIQPWITWSILNYNNNFFYSNNNGTGNPNIVGTTFTTSNNINTITNSVKKEKSITQQKLNLNFNSEYNFNCNNDNDVCLDSLNIDSGNLVNLNATLKTEETGRIDMGAKSNQEFRETYQEFEYFSFHTLIFKLLPKSKEPVKQSEIKLYCTGCGRKTKKNENFCPKCGNKH